MANGKINAAEKKMWVRPEITGTASLKSAQANKGLSGVENGASGAPSTGPTS